MFTFLFWNLGGRRLASSVTNLALRHEIDVLMLAECADSPADLLMSLNLRSAQYYFPRTECEKIVLLSRVAERLIVPVYEDSRSTIRRVEVPGSEEILLAVIHFYSKTYWSDASQDSAWPHLAQRIREIETRVGHSRTILVGDLNAHPFQSGVVSALGLHGVMDRRVAERGSRTIDGLDYPFFYNPMWGLFGDSTPGPSGTFFQWRSEPVCHFWNMLDQVLIRPALLPFLGKGDVRILDSDGESPLVNARGEPDADQFSDHLPLFFRMRL